MKKTIFICYLQDSYGNNVESVIMDLVDNKSQALDVASELLDINHDATACVIGRYELQEEHQEES